MTDQTGETNRGGSIPALRPKWGAVRQIGGGEFWSLYGIPIALVLVCVYLSFASEAFLTQRNITNIIVQSSVIAIAGLGTAIVFISGGVDISQGGVMVVSGLVTVAGAEHFGLPVGLALILGLGVGMAIGLLNGVLAQVVRIPPFIATLGTGFIATGLAYVYTNGQSISLTTEQGGVVQALGQGYVGDIPVLAIVLVVTYLAGSWVMSTQRWGLWTYAIGSSERAAQYCGINVLTHRLQVYTVAGLMSGLAGVLVAGRLGAASPAVGITANFDVITAVVLGGISLFGARGHVSRAIIGALFTSTTLNGMTLLNIQVFWQQVVIGTALLGALALDRLGSSK